MGELDPRYLAAYDVRAAHVVVADLDLAALAATVPDRRRASAARRGCRRWSATSRSWCGRTDAAGEVEAVIRAAGGPLLREVRLFDRYQGRPARERRR